MARISNCTMQGNLNKYNYVFNNFTLYFKDSQINALIAINVLPCYYLF
jgi:hypothetical protein